jgi:hypothetical protein
MAEHKKSLVDFVNTLHKNKGWQKKFEERKEKKKDWEDVVNEELSESDAEIALSEDRARLDAALGDKTPKRIVWEGAIVWG